MAALKIAVGVNPFVKFPRERDYIEIKHSILARTSFNHTLTTSNFYFLPGNQTNSATVWYLRYQLKPHLHYTKKWVRTHKKVGTDQIFLPCKPSVPCFYEMGPDSCQAKELSVSFIFFYCSPMKIRPGKADRKEKASSVYRLRQSTKDESMKRFLPLSHF